MNKVLAFPKSLLSDNNHTRLLVLFLGLLGSHFLDYHLYFFIALGLFLIDWHYVSNKNFLLVSVLILSIYVSWFFLDARIIYQLNLLKQVLLPGILILLMYMVGFSTKIKREGILLVSDKRMFYILFIFVISYTFFILWSYFFIPQDNPVTSAGMYVCFPNPYLAANINGGRLISTILTYYLTLMTFTLPLILFYFGKLKKQGFYTIELFLLVALALFVLYISAIMGRRTVFVLFVLVFLFLFFTYFMNFKNIKRVLIFISVIVAIFYTTQTYVKYIENIPEQKGIIVTDDFTVPIVEYPKSSFNVENISLFKRLADKGFKDSRFSWWKKSFSIMLAYPFGGGYDEYVAPGMKLTHNVWLDMGKDLGILPFILFFMVTIVHSYYLIRILFSKHIENLLKYQLVILGMGIFAIMLIEPVFNSDKTFFAYIFFYFGILGRCHLEMNTKGTPVKN